MKSITGLGLGAFGLGSLFLLASSPAIGRAYQQAVSAYGTYNSSAPTATSGFVVPLQTDVNGNLKVTAGGSGAAASTPTYVATVPTPSASFSPAQPDLANGTVSHTSKASAGNLLSWSVQDETATAAWFQVWNGTLGSGTLLDSVKVPAGSANSPGSASMGTTDYTTNGLYFSTSLAWGLSSTAETYTALGSGTGFTVSVRFK